MNPSAGSFDQLVSFSRLRRNHGLEHATLHVLGRRLGARPLAGHSDFNGFWILGDVDTPELESAIEEALRRMRAGEENLAVHPHCGTNYVTAGTVAGAAAWLGMAGVGRRPRDNFSRLPGVIMLTILGFLLGQPLGIRLQQRFTTSGKPGDLHVTRITPSMRGKIKAHRVETAG